MKRNLAIALCAMGALAAPAASQAATGVHWGPHGVTAVHTGGYYGYHGYGYHYGWGYHGCCYAGGVAAGVAVGAAVGAAAAYHPVYPAPVVYAPGYYYPYGYYYYAP